MTRDQTIILAILGVMLVLFLWDRLRYDLVALMALLAAVYAGVIKPEKAFIGFSNPLIALIAAALIVSTAVGRSGLVDALTRRMEPLMRTRDLQVGVLAGMVTVLSMFMKNIGALAIFLPVALQVAKRHKRSPSEMLMPLSFGSLLGGLVTLVGTSPNLLIASIRRDIEGEPFGMFDYTPVGLGLSLCAIGFLTFGWRLLPRGRRGRQTAETQFKIEDYTTEARVPAGAPVIGKTVGEFEKLGEGSVRVAAIIREQYRRYIPRRHWTLFEGDILVIEADSQALKQVIQAAGLELVESKEIPDEADQTETVDLTEAVVTADSPLVGASPAELRLRDRYGVNLVAVASRGRRVTARLRRFRLRPGDVIVLQGNVETMPDTLVELGCLPLAPRNLQLERPRLAFLPPLVLAVAMVATAFEVVPVAVAFVTAAVVLALFRVLNLRQVYESVEWPILILLGCLIPVGEAVHETGATDLIAQMLSTVAQTLPAWGVLAAVQVITMLATPILHHAAAVIVMGPVAASLAQQLGYNIDPFLMAVAVGAGCDFLSPIGHQCNTLVLGPGGYRFSDYWKLGLPLSIMVVVVGVPLILFFWPLK